MLVLKFTGLVYFAVTTICTGVSDSLFQRDYCSRTRECAEGTHVMCMYYDRYKPMGPVCSENATEVAVINRYKKLLLNIFNEIRKLAANGEETGKDDKLLPKAYGLKRLKWDDELAMFAQVFANQCSLTRDFCRATSKFPSPGQFTGVNVFKFPDWDISELNQEDLHEDKVIAALKNILKRAYFLKKLVTKQLIQNYPNVLNTRATDLFDRATILKQLYKIRPYLNIIHGGTSHVGCGISAYINRGNFKDQAYDGFYNILELTCNFSGEPTPELPVYETIRPTQLGWTTTCGCPPGFSEDEDCLCVQYGTRNKDEADSGRAARVMSLLQSFNTREEKLYSHQPVTPGNTRRLNPTYKVSQPNRNDAKTFLGAPHDTNLEAKLSSLKERILNKQLRKFIEHDITPEFVDIKLNEVPKQIYRRSRSPKPQLRKTSIFSRVNKFALPIQHSSTDLLRTFMTEPSPNIRNPIGINNEFHQVRPRKDYSKMSELVTEYVNKKRSRKSLPVINYLSQNRKLKSEQNVVVKQTTTPETMVIKKPDRSTIKEPEHNTKKESNNLFDLLDKLEQEVKYIELNEHVKEIVDKKMRRIYDSVIHDPKRLMTPEQSDVVDGLIKILNNKADDTEIPTTDIQLSSLLNKNLDEMRKDRVKFAENSPDSYGKVDDQTSYDVDSPTTVTDLHLPSLLNVNGDDRSKILEISTDSNSKGDDQLAFDPDTSTTEGQSTSFIKKKQDEMRQDRPKFTGNFAGSTGKGDIYDSFYRDDKSSFDDKLDAFYKRQGGNKPSGATNREMIRDFAIRDADAFLGSIRRKFYQDKLKNLRRKLEKMRGYTRSNDDEQDSSDYRPKSPFTTSLELTNTWSSSTAQNYNLSRPALLTAFEAE